MGDGTRNTISAATVAAAAAGDGIVAVDEDGIIRYCNSAAAELFARPVAELAGQPFGFPIVAGEAAEIDLVRPEGDTVAVDMRVTATSLEGVRLCVATLRDITRRRQAERELKTALEHQRVVVGVASHELNSPLYGIQLLLQTLRDDRGTFTEAQRKETIDRIAERITALQELLRKFLTASRIDSNPERPAVERVSVLDIVLERLAAPGGARRPVEVSCPVGLAVLASRVEVAEMIDNYLDNAFAHGRPPVEMRVSCQDGWVEVRVSDRGPGVPEAFVSRLFQRFSRAAQHTDGEGSGLGLWIVASLAANNGGHARYEPRAGGGACFCLSLPQAPPD